MGSADESLDAIVDPGKASAVVARVRILTGLSDRDVYVCPCGTPGKVAVEISQLHAGQGQYTRDLARFLRESVQKLGA